MADAEQLFSALCDERGGIDALSIVERAVCRQLANALVSDGSRTDIAALAALLPQPRVQRGPQAMTVHFVSPPERPVDEQVAELRERLEHAQGDARTAHADAERLRGELIEAKAASGAASKQNAPAAVFNPCCTVVESSASTLARMVYGNGGGDISVFYQRDPVT
jgi:hypothetical protein